MYRLKKWFLFMAGIVLILSGCGKKQQDQNTLIYGSSDYTSINPALYEHGEMNTLIFNGLTAHGKNNEIIPCLAEKWDYDEVSKTYTFYLRKDVLWQDGKRFQAEDVKYTIEAIKDPANGSEIASNYEEIKEIKIVNDYEVQLVLTEHCTPMLDYLTVGILPKHLLEGKDLITDEFNQKPIGTGPYKLTNWDMGQSITLTKNKDYFLEQPTIEKIVFKIINDTKVRALQLKSGEIDLAQVTPQDLKQFQNDEKYQTYLMKTADYRGILYNFNHEFFKNYPELPNALSYGINRQKIIDAVLLGHGRIAYSPIQMDVYYNKNMEQYTYEKERAKSMLEEAGWVMQENGFYKKDKEELKFTITCGEGDQVRVDMANICAQQLKEIGANVSVEVKADIDWAGQEAYLIGWGSPFDPDDHTYKVFGSKKGSNFSGYANKEVDRLLTAARETQKKEEKIKYYNEFQEELMKDMPYTFLAYVDAIYVSGKDLKGIDKEMVLGHHGVGIFCNIAEWKK